METHIENIKLILVSFLKKNGGYGNGFETYIGGSVSPNCFSIMDWSTPTSENLTGKEVRLKGRDLYNDLHEYLKKNSIKETLVVKNNHISDGCFETHFYFKPKMERVSFV